MVSLFYLVLGILAIISAIAIQLGIPLMATGFGDVFVFVFFGLVSTLGVNFLYSNNWISNWFCLQ
jgi:1,4-dihydroxy-2-naphthoate octaprenyltransferase